MKNLRKDVMKWVNEMEGNLNDVVNHGCQSGTVGHLIYYTDTTKYYNQHKDEINTILGDLLDDTGFECPSMLFGDKWDTEDPLAFDTQNQNLLAWFGFEEAARSILDDNE